MKEEKGNENHALLRTERKTQQKENHNNGKEVPGV